MEYLTGLTGAVDLGLAALAVGAAVSLVRQGGGPALRWTVGLLAAVPLVGAVSRWAPGGMAQGWLWLAGSGAWLGAVYLLWQTGLLRVAGPERAPRQAPAEHTVRLEGVRAVACWPRRRRGD